VTESKSPIPHFLRFGIPSLDRLITGETDYEHDLKELPTGIILDGKGSVSIALVGPDGTGKSVLGLHLASRYITDCWEWWEKKGNDVDGQGKGNALPFVFYVSTDLNYEVAESRLWKAFHLHKPTWRVAPFSRYERYMARATEGRSVTAKLKQLKPSDDVPFHLQRGTANTIAEDVQLTIGFVDLARNTAGDDWAYLTRLLALLRAPEDGTPRHLMVIDAVEGFEALVGERDAYGEPASRRSRIAQLMRLATVGGGKCHIAFIVGAHTPDEKLPEVFVTDFVIRLREVEANGYVRRTVQIEKARGYSHARGQHPYVIRSGKGSSTGKQENFDDPAMGEIEKRQGYFHVFRSLHYLSRTTMQRTGGARPEIKDKYAGFGVQYLDDMLAGSSAPARRVGPGRTDSSGLPCGSVTGLIGDSETQKSRLGRIFLSRSFATYPLLLTNLTEAIVKNQNISILEEVIQWHKQISGSFPFSLSRREQFWEHELEEPVFRNFVQETCKQHGVNELDTKVWPIFLASRLLDGTASYPQESVAVLLTTKDIDNATLARDFGRVLLKKNASDNPWDKIAVSLNVNADVLRACAENHFSKRTLCRRLEIHDLSSPILMHIVQSYIQAAQRIQTGARAPSSDLRMIESIGIRLVIDDFSVIRAIYPEVRTENLFLPYLLFYLRREGITTLIINTDPEKPGGDCKDRFEQEFRSLIDYRLFTWRVPFYGQDRVAIAAIPPLRTTPVVRELRADADEPTGVFVDPQFELYTGIDQGKPEPVSLEIRLFQETPAFEQYINRENLVYSKRFHPVPGQNGVIVGQARGEYEVLRDWCSLQNPQNLNHSLVLQVDEFWSSRADAFRKEDSYLGAVTVEADGSAVTAVDSSELFQASEATDFTPRAWRRYEFFQPFGYTLEELSEIDRIPFTWDFGFLLCRERCWREAWKVPLSLVTDREEPLLVGHVWNALTKIPPSVHSQQAETHKSNVPDILFTSNQQLESARSWRAFFEACQVVARVEGSKASISVPAFDLSLLTPESFSCLVLEMWASELLKTNPSLIKELSTKRWLAKEVPKVAPKSLAQWLVGEEFPGTIQEDYKALVEGKPSKCNRGWLALYKVWLLLSEVLNLADFVEPANSLEFRPREGNTEAVAIRHWYKTAAAQSDSFDPADPALACRLPGNFSVRGDWFLAVLKGSLSDRLADQALDLLSSKRANRVRMQLGLGLPTRFPHAHGGMPETPNELVRIKLFKSGEHGERERASYRDIIAIGQNTNMNFHWLWRSCIRDYDRHARIFQRWIGRTLLFWNRLRHDSGKEWRSGFQVYDVADSPDIGKFCADKDVTSLKMFAARCDFFLAELRNATLRRR